MFIRKSKISHLIQKERAKEKTICEKVALKNLQQAIQELENKHYNEVKNINKIHKNDLSNKNKEINNLQNEINKHYTVYQQLRRREKELDMLTADFEDMVDSMGIKIQESVQPFYRTRAKIENTKRKSNRKHVKVESIFRAAK